MKLFIEEMPVGCQAVVIGNFQGLEGSTERSTVNRYIGKAVCGGRQVEATSDFVEYGGFAVNNNGRSNATDEVQTDLGTMINAMCIDCPNRKENPID